MAGSVLLIQSDPDSAKTLGEYFRLRGDQVHLATEVVQASTLLDRQPVDLVLVDIHLPDDRWADLLSLARPDGGSIPVIVTNRHPDVQRELVAKERGAHIFLRAPFERQWIARAVRQAEGQSPARPAGQQSLPRVRTPLRLKITLPFILLGLMFVMGAAFLVSQFALASLKERFTNQLIDAGRKAADRMVEEERLRLQTLRLLANTAGMAEAVTAGDSARLETLALPVAVNNRDEAVVILNLEGVSLLTLRHRAGGGVADYDVTAGETGFATWDFVRAVLDGRRDDRGDKWAGFEPADIGHYFFVSGPVFDDRAELRGVILVGTSLPSLVRSMQSVSSANVSLYTHDGTPVISTLFVAEPAPAWPSTPLATQVTDASSPVRDVALGQNRYTEIAGAWVARQDLRLGLIGASLAQNFVVQQDLTTSVQTLLLVSAGFLLVIAAGVLLAAQLTRPLRSMMQASNEVARGNFNVKVPAQGNDEVAVLAHAFNRMVSGLQEGSIYRDLLGRTVSPEVREQMRQSFASGNLRLEGQNIMATVLMSDIRGFTTVSETQSPTTVMKWLNEYFNELVPVIAAHGGVVDKFEGDAILAFFGVLPRATSPRRSAAQACDAALEMLQAIEVINQRRQARGEVPFVTGIGINTGLVTAGGLGASDRLNYTIIGDAVNTTQRLEGFTRQFGESGIVISTSTLEALGGGARRYTLADLGAHVFKGKSEAVNVYRLIAGERARTGPLPAEVVEPEDERIPA